MVNIIPKFDVGVDVDKVLIENIFDIARTNLPAGNLLILFANTECENLYGLCEPKSLLIYLKNIYRFSPYPVELFDTGIKITSKTNELYIEFPTFFAYILGHELGHAHISLQSPELHLHSCLIQNHISPASDNRITRCHELPHEITCDEYGIYIVDSIFTKYQFKNEINEMKSMARFKDDPWLDSLLQRSGSKSIDPCKLRKELIQFSLPHKDKLIALWKKDIQDRTENGDKSLAELVLNFEGLFDQKLDYSKIFVKLQ